MASIRKYKAHQTGRIFLHNNRSPNDGVEHSNEEIDPARTANNYFLKRGSVNSLNSRLSEVFQSKNDEKQTVVMAEAVVTLPNDVKGGDERAFFEAVYDFYAEDFGEENIINAVVHRDEKRPHIHLDFVPTVTDTEVKCKRGNQLERNKAWLEEHGGTCERLSAKEAIDREYFQTMHERLSAFVGKELGYEVEILNGATANGNKKVLQLKVETLKKQIETFEARQEHFKAESEEMHKTAQKWGIAPNDVGLLPLMKKIDDLEQKNRILQEIIAREGYRYTRSDLERLKEKKFTASQAVSVSVYDGSLVSAEIDPNAIVAIELPQDGRPLPQKSLIDRDADLDRQYKMSGISSSKATLKKSKVTDRIYAFLKTGDERQTIDCILELERQLRENEDELKGRRLYIDRLENDRFDLTRSVLNTLDLACNYYARRDLEEKQETQKQREQSLS